MGLGGRPLRQRPVDHIRANMISPGFILTERSSSRSGGKEHHRGDSPIHPGLASALASRTGSIWGMLGNGLRGFLPRKGR
jgi:NAD(P)-dependent dehydrogenase (short-subunit alcohol dehydrogenase family)